MIAMALINDPQVLIADEPTSALDVRLRNQILELLVTQCEQRQMAMLLISHDLPLVAQFCHRVIVMYQEIRSMKCAPTHSPLQRILTHAHCGLAARMRKLTGRYCQRWTGRR